MLYFEPFLGNGGYQEQTPAYTYKRWATRFLGSTNGYDDDVSYRVNLERMLDTLNAISKRVQISVQEIGNAMLLNNINYYPQLYSITPAQSAPIYSGFTAYLDQNANVTTSISFWATYQLPTVSDGAGGVRAMNILEAYDYLIGVARDISITKSTLTLIHSMSALIDSMSV